MSVIPGLELRLDEVGQQLIDMVEDGSHNGIEYTGLWLQGERFEGDPGELAQQPAGILSYAIFYPNKTHPTGGYIVSITSPDSDYLAMMQGVELNPDDVAEDYAQNNAIRKQLATAVIEKGGLLANVADTCERLRVPLGAIVLWVKEEDDELPSLASFHSLATLPPAQALKALKFAIWERTSHQNE